MHVYPNYDKKLFAFSIYKKFFVSVKYKNDKSFIKRIKANSTN